MQPFYPHEDLADPTVIVSRHPAAIEFLRKRGTFSRSRIVAQATADDVRGKIVAGNLPLNLAALAGQVHVIEFTGPPPRGQEYSLEDMYAAGAVLRRYRVISVDDEIAAARAADEASEGGEDAYFEKMRNGG